MKKISPFSIFTLVMFLTTACGSPAATATESPAQPVASVVPAASIAPAATAIPTQPAPAGNSTEVIITLEDNTIDASQTAFQVGVPYTFVITNSGGHAHNFNISTPVSVAGSLNAALSSALLAVPQAQLSAGSSVTVEYTFPESAAGQNLEFSCLIRRHYDDGMLLPITVTN